MDRLATGSETVNDQAIVRLYLLGGFRAERSGSPVPAGAWQRRSGRTLVKLLATEPTHRLHRAQILDLLWPDLDPEPAANALRKALHFARHALDPDLSPRQESAVIRIQDDTVLLPPGVVWIDVDDFWSRAQTALAQGDQAAIEHALAAYTGELLPEDRYEDWTIEPRGALVELQVALLMALAARQEQQGQYGAAVASLRRVVAIDLVREDVHRQVMRLCAQGGQRHQALRQYRVCRDALSRELDAEPDAETEALYQDIVTGRIAGDSRPGSMSQGAGDVHLPATVRRLGEGPLVGREPARRRLAEVLNRAREGRGATVLVGGEAGVGKTRLVAEVACDAHDLGALVLWGACYEQEGQLPYGPLVEALDRAGAGQPPDVRHRLAATYPELAGLVPSLGPVPQRVARTEPAEADRTRLFAEIARLLDELRGDRPLILVLDDLHAADTATLQLLHHLMRIAAECRWLILGTYREEDVAAGSELQQLRTVAVQTGLCQRIELGRLARDECDQLIALLLASGDVPSALQDDLYQRSLGNPLFVHELVRAMREQETLELDAGRWTVGGALGVPQQLGDLIELRVDRLGEHVRRVLVIVAAAGEACSFRILQDAGDLADAALLDALDRGLAAHLLEERGDGYGFQHPLVRATLYERLSRPRRASLHAALALAIERQHVPSPANNPERIETLAHHWAEAGEAERAVPYLIQAADRAAQVYATSDAILRLRRALSLFDAAPGAHHHHQPAQRTALLERLGDLLALVGETAQARDAFTSALLGFELDPLTIGRLHRKAAQQALVAGDLAGVGSALALAEASLGGLPQSQPLRLERARGLLVLAQEHFLQSRFPEALAAAEASRHLADEACSPADVDRSTELLAMTSRVLGQWQRGLDYERQHGGLADTNQFVQDVADVHLCLAEYYAYRDPDQTIRGAERFLASLAESERIGAPRSLALCHYFLGTESYFRGRFGEAVSRLTTSADLYDQVGSASGAAIALMMRGVTRTALGHLEDGRQDLERGLVTAEQAPLRLRSHAMIRLYAGLGWNCLDANDPAGARRHAEAGLALADEPSTCICYAAIYPMAAAAFALTGDLDQAAALGKRALRHARDLDSPVYLCQSYQAIAMVHTLAGEWDAAFAALDAALRLAEAQHLPYERGRVLLHRAFVHMQRRDAPDLVAADALRSEALPMLLRLGVRASAHHV